MRAPRSIRVVTSLLGVVACAGGVACSSTSNGGGGGTGGKAGGGIDGGGGSSVSDASDGPSYTYALIDDMESTTHGPILLATVVAPLSPGYWFNFGANVRVGAAGGDTATPTINQFVFSPLPSPMTWRGRASKNGAHQACSLTGQYDVCGLGFEFAQVPLVADGGTAEAGSGPVDSSTATAESDGATVGPPMVTVPFDISAFKGITFWGKAAAGSSALDVKVQFPNTDTDPRGGVCNGPLAGVGSPSDISRCYNSYAVHTSFTGDWQQFTVLFSDLAIDPSFGFQQAAPFNGTNIYGLNWQGQKNSDVDAGAADIDFWVDDVYLIR